MGAEIDIRLYVGRGGTGKSTLLRKHLAGEKRLIVLDANAEAEYETRCETVTTSLAEAARAAMAERFSIAIRTPFGGDAVKVFEAANRIAWMAGNCRMVWEEVHNYRKGSDLPATGVSLINQGRHRGVALSAATRRPVYLRTLTASATDAFVFHSTEENDLKFYEAVMGREAAAAAGNLKEYHFVHWNAAAGWKACRPVRFRK